MIRCGKHPKYQARRKPRSACEACWYIYAVANWWACVETYCMDHIKGLRQGRAL